MKDRVSKVIWGLILLLLAVGLIMYKLGNPIVAFLPGIGVWQIILGLAFLAIFIDSISKPDFGGMMFSLAFLGIVFAKQLKIEALVPWTLLLAALLLTIALNLIFGGKHKNHHKYIENGCMAENSAFLIKPGEPETVEGEYIYERASFSGVTKYVHSDNFNYAQLENSFAGMEIFFDNVLVPSGHATIEVNSSFGGVEIYVPKEWKIVNKVSSFAGACEVDDRSWTGDSTVEVAIIGSNRFGGIEVKRI